MWPWPLVAFDAVVQTIGPSGPREIAIDDFYLLPDDTPEVEHPLEQGELIAAIEVPPLAIASNSLYLKFRDRQSYEFALVSVAAALEVSDGVVADVRLALGGVGTKPWRARRAEAELTGAAATADAVRNRRSGGARARRGARAQRVQGRAGAAGHRAGPDHGDGRMTSAIGRSVSRVDGPAKVSGAARYSGEILLPGLAHAAIVGATIPSGRVTAIQTGAAQAAAGVAAILTHQNLPKIAGEPKLLPSLAGGPAPGESFFPMQDEVVHYAGQPVAIVIADSVERAHWAASLVGVSYERTPSITTIDEGRDAAAEAQMLFGGLMPARNERGDVERGLAEADLRIDAEYRMAANHHNPIEPPTTTAVWDEDRLTIYDSTMGVRASQLTVSHLLGVPLAKVRVITSFVGGSFGMKAMVWPHVTLAAMAAQHVRRPVRLAMTRPQMFTSSGHREEQEQRITIGARRDGRLTAIRHEKLSITSPFDDWAEPATGVSSQLYACENFEGFHRLIHGNTMTPTFTRGPGESVGSFVLETRDGRAGPRVGHRSGRPARSGPRRRRPARQPLDERRARAVPAPRRRALRLAGPEPAVPAPSVTESG